METVPLSGRVFNQNAIFSSMHKVDLLSFNHFISFYSHYVLPFWIFLPTKSICYLIVIIICDFHSFLTSLANIPSVSSLEVKNHMKISAQFSFCLHSIIEYILNPVGRIIIRRYPCSLHMFSNRKVQ